MTSKQKHTPLKIAILSRRPRLYSTRRLVEAALERGHHPIVLDHLKCYMMMQKGKPSIRYAGKEITGIDAVIPRIGASVTFYGSALVRQFEMMKVFTVNESQGIVRSRDKLRSLQILSREGIDLPKTAFAYSPEDIDDLITRIGGAPCIIKLLEGTQGIGVVLAETRKAAKSVIEAFYGLEARIIIQEFIQEAKGADIRALIIDGEVVAAMRRQGKEGDFRSNLHRGGVAKPIDLSKSEREIAIQSCNALGLSVAGVDMIQSKRGPLVLEVNSSPGLRGIETSTGINVAGKVIEFIERNTQHFGKIRKDKIGK